MQHSASLIRCVGRAGLPAALLLLSALAALAVSGAGAQETLVAIGVDADQPIPAGTEFEAVVTVQDVSNLAGFDFTIQYDPERIGPVEEEGPAPPEGEINVRVLDVGLFITENGDRQDMICDDPSGDVDGHTITVSCVTVGPPVCLGGDTGASGSGVLGRVVLESLGGGETTLVLTKSTLVLDDVAAPCDGENLTPQAIEHRNEDLTIELSGSSGGGGSNVGLIIGVIVGVLVVAGAGVAGAVWYARNRTSG